MARNIHLLFWLPEFNLALIGSFSWLTPPGSYRATTCWGRELKYESHTYFFYHTRTWGPSRMRWSAQCRGHLRDSRNTIDDTTRGTHSVIPTRRIINDNYGGKIIFGDLCGPKVFWHLSYRWGKTPEKEPYSGNLSRSGIEPGPVAWHARMVPPVPQRWTNIYLIL